MTAFGRHATPVRAELRRRLRRVVLGASVATLALPTASASAFSFGPDLTTATPDNTWTCSVAAATSGCTAYDALTSSMSLFLPDPFSHGNQTGIVTALHVLSATTAPAQFVVIEWSAHRGVTGSVFPSGIMAVSAPVTLHPGINNFNTNLPVDYRWSPSSGFDSWSVVALNILDGTSPVPGWTGAPLIDGEPGLGGETGLLLDCGTSVACPSILGPTPRPFTTAVSDITVAPHYATVSGFAPMRLLLSGEVTNTTPGGGPPPNTTPGGAAPVLAKVTQAARRWREGNALPHIAGRLPVGTSFRFTLDQTASVRFAFTQQRRGRRVAHKCVPQTKRNERNASCQRTVTVGTLTLTKGAGAHSLRFQGRISRTKRLQPGRYTVTIAATNSAGRRSAAHSLTFTIVKR